MLPIWILQTSYWKATAPFPKKSCPTFSIYQMKAIDAGLKRSCPGCLQGLVVSEGNQFFLFLFLSAFLRLQPRRVLVSSYHSSKRRSRPTCNTFNRRNTRKRQGTLLSHFQQSNSSITFPFPPQRSASILLPFLWARFFPFSSSPVL